MLASARTRNLSTSLGRVRQRGVLPNARRGTRWHEAAESLVVARRAVFLRIQVGGSLENTRGGAIFEYHQLILERK